MSHYKHTQTFVVYQMYTVGCGTASFLMAGGKCYDKLSTLDFSILTADRQKKKKKQHKWTKLDAKTNHTRAKVVCPKTLKHREETYFRKKN